MLLYVVWRHVANRLIGTVPMPLDRSISDHLPLTESSFFILLSLASEPKHGYAIMKDVRSLSDGRVQ